jgi:hypothetical protein
MELIHQNVNIFGVHQPGFRAVHRYGRFSSGTFTATDVAKTFSHAARFAGPPVPATARLSYAAADPAMGPNNVVAMATRFYLRLSPRAADSTAFLLPTVPAAGNSCHPL